MLTRKGIAMEDQQQHVDKAKKILGRWETRLANARSDAALMERWVKDAYRLGMISATDAAMWVARFGQIGGDIASVEEQVYGAHAFGAEKAKAKGLAIIGTYETLKAFQPPVAPRDGGGGR